jgi:hypothetical protein
MGSIGYMNIRISDLPMVQGFIAGLQFRNSELAYELEEAKRVKLRVLNTVAECTEFATDAHATLAREE